MITTKCEYCGHILFVEYLAMSDGLSAIYYDGDDPRSMYLAVTCRDCGNWLPGYNKHRSNIISTK
ncbi:MAG TPA: hypothetical protein ACFYEK_08395 [Candidatus Wunengus sp. YC60]|uniref:hypothetical protein n=1 Tax=Candidatus Wunengus sp. YC60 TaxID=3367697 RepID=UPI0040292001